MRPRERRDSGQNDLFKARLDHRRHGPRAGEARPGDHWRFLEKRFAAVYSDRRARLNCRRPPQCSRSWSAVGGLFSGSSCRWLEFAPCGHKLGQADDVVGGHGEDESGADLGEAAHLHLRQAADRLRPAEAFLDALAQRCPRV
jgi:hypothetical protein